MNKESLLAIIFGLIVGLAIFMIVSHFPVIIHWLHYRQPMTSNISNTPTKMEKPTVIVSSVTPTPEVTSTHLISPSNYFLVKEGKIKLELKTSPGAVFLIQNGDKVYLTNATKSDFSYPLSLESGSNLVRVFQISDELQPSLVATLSGVLSNKKYPQSAGGSFGLLKTVEERRVELITPSGRLELKVLPQSQLYAFKEDGRRVTLTELDKSLEGKKALVIFKPLGEGKNEGELIKLLITPHLDWPDLSWFKGKITKVDDVKKICQLADLKNKVKEIKLNELKVVDLNAKPLKITDIGLETQVLVVFLDNQPKLMIASPEISLIK